jgi:hypothetical protein
MVEKETRFVAALPSNDTDPMPSVTIELIRPIAPLIFTLDRTHILVVRATAPAAAYIIASTSASVVVHVNLVHKRAPSTSKRRNRFLSLFFMGNNGDEDKVDYDDVVELGRLTVAAGITRDHLMVWIPQLTDGISLDTKYHLVRFKIRIYQLMPDVL